MTVLIEVQFTGWIHEDIESLCDRIGELNTIQNNRLAG